jgi:Family of unknown function (DUF6328)
VNERAVPEHPESGRPEPEFERIDRNLLELLNELRVALPGVQVLFAFLLVVPFSNRFGEATTFEEAVFYLTLVCTAVASALFIAPSAHHRVQFRQQDKEHIVLLANRFALAAFAFLAVAMTGAVVLITSFLFGTGAAVASAVGAAALFGVLWFVIPIRRRRTLVR